MGHLSTHAIDTMHGCPAIGMTVRLLSVDAGATLALRTLALDADGRALLLDAVSMAAGRWRLQFSVAAYFRARGVPLPDPPFLDEVSIDFGIADAAAHYHVPLLVSPWGYATYRGS